MPGLEPCIQSVTPNREPIEGKTAVSPTAPSAVEMRMETVVGVAGVVGTTGLVGVVGTVGTAAVIAK